VILHSAISLDGRTTGFPVDLGLFYSLAGTWREDATLTGADTLLAAPEAQSPEDDLAALETRAPECEETVKTGSAKKDPRPLLIVTDSRGRLRHWTAFLASPYWRGGIALVSRATPRDYTRRLARLGIEILVAGKDQVDLIRALELLAERYKIRTVRTDSGGALAGALLRAGLVSEVSVVAHPALAGDSDPHCLFRDPRPGAPVRLRLIAVEPLPKGILWLRYKVLN